mmetsp:Transcript_94398/g.236964  ORF Transcript_94398/g.236964 Transcript_94398/m.236964 type:complete len:206 (-) Transcript_94398:228-845(-)|eukprot:CAMPEP_0115660056 /NCGR_PEP_ID=MMETSP0272-20121206/46043_1 /TAXON_ID=71861 /ORGANISM="Scrippsiella trochoidea, Strain CCMP3099" /LENGTH=205 /DNA_ID=CAMNT_0003098191 /DNA_START=53 /DNA_END=670 /DNA_ORIENTATION=-
MASANLQDSTEPSSVFILPENSKVRRCRQRLSTSGTGRSGSHAGIALINAPPENCPERVCLQQIEDALRAQDVVKLCEIRGRRLQVYGKDLPLDNRQMMKLGRRVAGIMRSKLRQALGVGDAVVVHEAMRVVEIMQGVLPYCSEVKQSTEYKEAQSFDGNDVGFTLGPAELQGEEGDHVGFTRGSAELVGVEDLEGIDVAYQETL